MSADFLPHAYLFAGPSGLGKYTMAMDVMRQLVPQGYEPDRMVLAPTRDEETGKLKDISIDAVRKELIPWVSLRPMGTHKIAIIDDADRLGGEAANALLKAIEEPPAYLYFFLITSNPGQMLGTISSRCERMDFLPLTSDQMHQALSEHKVSIEDALLLATVAGGRPGTALEILQQKRLPLVAQSIAQFSRAMKGGVAEKITFAKTIADDITAPEQAQWWLSYVHTQLPEKPHLAPVARGLLDLTYVLGQSHYNRRLALEQFLLGSAVSPR